MKTVSATTLLVAALMVLCGVLAPTSALAIQSKPFGIESFFTQTTETTAEGVSEPYLFTQASGHPYALTTSLRFASEETAGQTTVGGDAKDVAIDLPPGLVANPQATVHCSGQREHCPADSQIGVFALSFVSGDQQLSASGPIVNMTPPPGVVSELGLEVPVLGRVLLTGRLVYTPEGYSLAIVGRGLPVPNLGGEFPPLRLLSMETTLWGVPADRSHDFQRGQTCDGFGNAIPVNCNGGGVSSGEEPEPFLTMPSVCSAGGLTTVAWADSWERPGAYTQVQSNLSPMAYCDRLPFHPEIAVRPESSSADGGTGVSVNVKVPQIESSVALVATPPLRSATITLPQGLSINPSVGDGLVACPATGPTGIDIPTGLNASGEALQPGEEGPGEEVLPEGSEEPLLAPGHCPEASAVGTANAITPFLPFPIEGRVYMATPGCGGTGHAPCSEQDAVDGNLYRLYVELGGRGSGRGEGVLIKLVASVQANPATGQLTVRLSGAPQLPIGQLSLRLFGGERSLLANPSKCGPATTTVDLEPWSAPYSPDAAPYSYYEVTGCSGHALTPTLIAGSVNALAGAFSPFVFTVSRGEGEPYLAQLQLRAPPGLSAMLSSVGVCEEALATIGRCPEGSRVGSSTVAAGAGSPLRMAGVVYLTGPYEGAPFGLSIVTNAVSGPLDLGAVVIRARIDVDPHTGALIITSDRLPQIVLGVPLRVRQITLDMDRGGFILNPTDCNAEQITATIAGVEGPAATPTNPFAVGGCRGLAFKPTIKASTVGNTSYAGGGSLDLKLALPKGEVGTEANLARIKVALPPQLPSRLTTLQGACRGGTFDTNPAACPATSIVGVARASTPTLSTPLTGPVYLVSRGANVFPSPVVVLQGEGIALDLSGSTTVHGSGSSVTFNAIPDMPVQSMEIYLPQGPHSLLSANTKLCALGKLVTVTHTVTRRIAGHTVTRKVRVRERVASLPMPTSLVAQNGLVVHKAAKIAVVGCGGGAAALGSRDVSKVLAGFL